MPYRPSALLADGALPVLAQANGLKVLKTVRMPDGNLILSYQRLQPGEPPQKTDPAARRAPENFEEASASELVR